MGKDTDCVVSRVGKSTHSTNKIIMGKKTSKTKSTLKEICRNLQAGREEGAGLGNQRNKSRRGRGGKTIERGAANRSDVWSRQTVSGNPEPGWVSEVSARSSHTHSRAAENKPKADWGWGGMRM